MKIRHLLIPALIVLAACNKHDYAPDPNNTAKKDYSSFLAETNPSFNSYTQDGFVSWSFGVGTAQEITGYQNASGLCDSADPVKVALFGLTSEKDTGQTRFWLNSMPYNITAIDSLGIAEIFSTGVKKLGSMGKNFSLTILQNGTYYQSYDTCTNSTIEILKTDHFFNEYGVKILRVWFKIDGQLGNPRNPSKPMVLKDGFMVANFWNFCKAY